jgi:F-type H+-transporting ATPase subunit delta
MKNEALVRIYTRSLFDLAVESGKIEDLAAELGVLNDLFKQVPQLSEYLESPNVSRAQKLDLLKKAYDKPWSDYFRNFLELVLRKGRQEILPFAYEAYRRYWDDYLEKLEVKVTSAVELSEEQKQAISRKLTQSTGKNIELECKVDPSVIGGIRLQIGHQLLDATVTGKLAALKEVLLRA